MKRSLKKIDDLGGGRAIVESVTSDRVIFLASFLLLRPAHRLLSVILSVTESS